MSPKSESTHVKSSNRNAKYDYCLNIRVVYELLYAKIYHVSPKQANEKPKRPVDAIIRGDDGFKDGHVVYGLFN